MTTVADLEVRGEQQVSQADVGPDQGFRPQLLRFLGGALLALLGLFVVLRLPVVQVYVLQPWAEFLAQMAATSLQWLGHEVSVNGEVLSARGHSLRVSEECSGLEVIGVYLAVTAVYPAPWLWRFGGIVWGLMLFQLLNFVRILVLFLVEDGSLFDLFHVYLWPLVLVGAGCVSWFVWIAGAKAFAHRASTNRSSAHTKAAPMPFPIPWQRALLFVGLVGLLMLLRSAVLNSPPTHHFAHAVTSGAASLLCWVGTPTQATGPVITSGSTAISVGAGCAASPTLVLALAAILVVPLSLSRRALWLVLLLPLFYFLNVLRIVGVIGALLYWPSIWRWIEDYFLLSSVIVGLILGLGWWQTQHMEPAQKQRFWLRLGAGVAGGIGVWFLVGGAYGQVLLWSYQQILASIGIYPAELLPHNPERVLTALPVFQGIFFLVVAVGGLWSWRQLLVGAVSLYGAQLVCLLGVFLLIQGFGAAMHHYWVRGWIIAIPCLLIWIFEYQKRVALQTLDGQSVTILS